MIIRHLYAVSAVGDPVSFATSGTQADLSQEHLQPGTYLVGVTAVGPNNLRSSTASQIVTLTATDLQAARVYPNPWRKDRNSSDPVFFDSLISGSEVKIFTVSGRHVKTLPAPTGSVSWWLDTDSGDPAASGVYLYVITDPQSHHTRGKIAVIR